MAFWSGETIAYRNNPVPFISDFDPARIDCAAYTLRMGREVFITPHVRVEPRYAQQKLILTERQNFHLPPGQFAFLLTKEFIELPIDTIAFISLKSGIKYLGLVNVSGFHVDPGFRGHLVYAVYNAGPSPIQLAEDQSLFLIWFAHLDNYNSIYHRLDRPSQTNISRELLQNIPGQIFTLESLSNEFERLDDRITKKVEELDRQIYDIRTKIYAYAGAYAGAIAALVTIIALVFKFIPSR